MNKKNIAKIITFPVLLGITLFCLDSFFFDKAGNKMTENTLTNYRLEKEDTLDLTFIGSSTVWQGIIPTQFYKETNLTCRTIAKAPFHAGLITDSLQYVFKKQENTRFIYIDLVPFFYLNDENINAFIKDFYFSFPEGSKERRKLAEKYSFLSKYEKKDYNLDNNLFKNHNDYRRDDFWAGFGMDGTDYYKGFNFQNITKECYKLCRTDTSEKDLATINPDGFRYLNDLLSFADKHTETKFIFARTARQLCKAEEANLHTGLMEWADKYITAERIKNNPEARNDYIVKDFALDADEIGIDEKTDQRDEGHLNIKGAKKFTKYLANYFKTNFDLSGIKHSKEVTDNFDEAYRKTEEHYDYLIETGLHY